MIMFLEAQHSLEMCGQSPRALSYQEACYCDEGCAFYSLGDIEKHVGLPDAKPEAKAVTPLSLSQGHS